MCVVSAGKIQQCVSKCGGEEPAGKKNVDLCGRKPLTVNVQT